MIRVVLVGAGTIGATHAHVLGEQQLAQLVGVVDVEKPTLHVGRQQLPTWRSLQGACATLHPDLVVIATPTATHLDLVEQVLRLHSSCAVLIEKPAAATGEELVRLARIMRGPSGMRLRFAHHTAYAPEVLWLARRNEFLSAQGVLTSATCVFHDPYQRDAEGSRQRLGSPWIDSGINALSVLARFGQLGARSTLRSLDERGLVEEARVRLGPQVDGEGPSATIVTSWAATASSKSTRLTYESGLEVHLDHTGVSGFAFMDGHVVDRFASDADAPRAVQHYRNLYRALFGVHDALLSWETTRGLLAALLSDDTPLAPARPPPAPRRWRSSHDHRG